MRLQAALAKATSVSELYDIFKNDVRVELGSLNDAVTVSGYEGSVSTDTIAYRIIHTWTADREQANQLAEALKQKVFLPLKALIYSPENKCSLYQLVALTRIGYTPPPETPELDCCIALKHGMCFDFIYQAPFSWPPAPQQ